MDKVSTQMRLLLVIVVATLIALGVSSTLHMRELAVLQDQGQAREVDAGEVRFAAQMGARMYEVIADAIINRDLEQTAKDWTEAKREAKSELDKVAKIVDTDAERKSLMEADKATEDVVHLVEDRLMPLLRIGTDMNAPIRALDDQIDQKMKVIESSLNKVSLAIDEDAKVANAAFTAVKGRALWLNVGLSLLAVVLVAVLTFRTGRKILTALGGEPAYAKDVVTRIAEGDLTHAVAVPDSAQQSLLGQMSRMQESLRRMLAGIQSSAEQLATASRQAAANAHGVEDKSRQQSDATAAMAASVEEVTVSINHVSDSAQHARDSAQRAGDLAAQGAGVVQDAANRMQLTAESVASTTRGIESLSNKSAQINLVVNVIKEIADQTNLLALNAAIEAARAGEQGRGFAVVADEVRLLAERTAKSTTEITGMVSGIQQETATAVKSMQNESQHAQEGGQLAGKARDAIAELQVGTNDAAMAISEISDALREQSAASTQIAQNVERIAQITDENLQEVHQIAAATDRLGKLSEDLLGMTHKFKL
jgi:methyl-accepting chemotaxis protein